MQIKAIKTRIFRENEDLFSFILKYVKNLKENSVLVITSKIVALGEGRTVLYQNEKQKAKLIREESDLAIQTFHTWLTIKDGVLMSSAGIDVSNANGKIILLPKDSFKTAASIRAKLSKKFHIKNLGVLIVDSRLFPLRAGVVGFALGYAGFAGIKNYIGTKDLFGRRFKMCRANIADDLATGAVLCMGEGKEQQPLAIITDAPVMFTNKVNKKELIINPKVDIYAPLFNKLN